MSTKKVQRVRAAVIPTNVEMVPTVARVGTSTRIQTQTSVNRIAAITGRTKATADALAQVYELTAEATEEGVRRLDRHDTAMARLGEEAMAEHQVTKDNLRRRQHQVADQAATMLQLILRRDLIEVQSQPDSAFYDPSPRERFAAWWWDDTSIELQRRNLPPLTLREALKELAIGGVIDAKAAEFDTHQMDERREQIMDQTRFASLQEQVMALMERNSELEAIAVGQFSGDAESDHQYLNGEVEEPLHEVVAADQRPTTGRSRTRSPRAKEGHDDANE